jgi:hypothetical protein
MSLSEAISTVVTAGPENVLGKDVGLFADIKQYFVDFINTMKSDNYAFNVFEKNLLFLKAFALIAITLMAGISFYYYRNTGLIKKQPYVFACESFIFALSALLPFLMVCYLRNQKYNVNQITMISIVLFIVMFAINYLLEISGFYAWSFDVTDIKDKDNDKDKNIKDDTNPSSAEKLGKTVSRTSEIVMIGIIIGSLVALLFSSFFVMNLSPDYVHLTSLPTGVLFFLEMLLFGFISAIPIFIVSYNRKKYENDKENEKQIDPPVFTKTTIIEFFVIIIKFALLHCLLQISGLYKSVFHTA